MSTPTSDSPQSTDILLGGNAAIQPTAEGSAIAGNLCQSTESNITEMAKPSPHTTVHDVLSTEIPTVLTISKTTPQLDDPIESDDASTIPYSSAKQSRPTTPSFIPQDPNDGKSFAPHLVSSKGPIEYHGEHAMRPHETLSRIEETRSDRGSKRKRVDDCELEGSQNSPIALSDDSEDCNHDVLSEVHRRPSKVHRRKARKISFEDYGELKVSGLTHMTVGLEAMQERNRTNERILQSMLKRNQEDRRYLANVIDYLRQKCTTIQ